MISTRLRVVAVFLVFFAFALVLSTPTPRDELAKRSNGDDVLSILTTIKSATDTILPKIDALVAGGQVSDATLRPLLTQLASTASTAIKGLSALQRPITFTSGTASQADIVTLASQICSDLARSAVGVLLVITNLLATAVFAVTSVLQNLTGLSITLPGLPPITLFR